MSQVNLAHSHAPGHDDLVPSRYALKVGDIDVMVISDGVLPITTTTMATNAAKDDLAAWLGVIANEPTTALDVTVQAVVLRLLRAANERDDAAMLFISHDIGVVGDLCDRVLVMYAGRLVEELPRWWSDSSGPSVGASCSTTPTSRGCAAVPNCSRGGGRCS